MRGLRVVVLYDDPEGNLPRGPSWEQTGPILPLVVAIEEAIASRGGDPVRVGIEEAGFEFVDRIGEARPDLILNLCDSLFGETQYEPTLGGVLESLGVPFTGTGWRGLALALDKSVCKAVLRARGLPTPTGQSLLPYDVDEQIAVRLPAMVKPSAEDGSIGISAESVVRTRADLRSRVAYIWEQYRQPALVEEYVDGREINIAVWGNEPLLRPLPPSEIDFAGFPDSLPRICTLRAKWDEESAEYAGSRPVCPALVEPDLLARLNRIAVRAFEVFHLRDYGRVDFRVDRAGEPQVIDVNPNPDLSPDAGFARTAEAAGYGYPQMLEEIARVALTRHRRAAPGVSLA